MALFIDRPSRLISTSIAAVLVLGGIYLLVTALAPMGRTWLTNPTDNSTTKLLAKTESAITKQQLYIPKIDINVPYAAGDESVMKNGAWWRAEQNGNPRDGGNFVLSAHRFIMGLTPQQTWQKSPFYDIDKLVVGDKIVIDYEGKRYNYEITKIFAVKPEAIEIENRTNEPQLTLYSCTLGGASDGREVIIATPILAQK